MVKQIGRWVGGLEGTGHVTMSSWEVIKSSWGSKKLL